MPDGETQIAAEHLLSQECHGGVIGRFDDAPPHDQRRFVHRIEDGGGDVGFLHGADQ